MQVTALHPPQQKHCFRAYLQIIINSVEWFSGLDFLIQGANNELTANLDYQTLASHRLSCSETGAQSHQHFPPSKTRSRRGPRPQLYFDMSHRVSEDDPPTSSE